MHKIAVLLLGALFALGVFADDCVDCHRKVTPGAVADWEASKHSTAEKDKATCKTCHGKDHNTKDDAKLAKMPTAATCGGCHDKQQTQFEKGKHNQAWLAMTAMPTTHMLPAQMAAGQKGCGGCHKMGAKSKEEVAKLKAGGQHYGNASCDACHTRHTFSKKEAQQPQACQTCHMGFDHPQWEMYSTSKHGSIYLTQGSKWDWNIELGDWFANPEKASVQRPRAPVCSTCHMPKGDHAVRTAWGFLALRLPEKDEEWLKYRQKILIGLGILTTEGQPTARLDVVKVGKVARLSAEEWQAERDRMIAVCINCHARSFAVQNLAAADSIIKESDKLMAEAIDIVEALYHDGVIERPKDRPPHPDLLRFYEVKYPIEQKLYVMFLEHRMRSFQGAFHMNPDYQHWYGWAEMKRDLYEIRHEAEELRAARGKSAGGE